MKYFCCALGTALGTFSLTMWLIWLPLLPILIDYFLFLGSCSILGPQLSHLEPWIPLHALASCTYMGPSPCIQHLNKSSGKVRLQGCHLCILLVLYQVVLIYLLRMLWCLTRTQINIYYICLFLLDVVNDLGVHNSHYHYYLIKYIDVVDLIWSLHVSTLLLSLPFYLG